MNNAVSAVLAIVGGVIGLAIISVLVSSRAQTPAVFGAAGGALANVIGAAVSPVTGQSVPVQTNGGGAGGGLGGGGLFNLGNVGNFLPGGLSTLFGG